MQKASNLGAHKCNSRVLVVVQALCHFIKFMLKHVCYVEPSSKININYPIHEMHKNIIF